jgi:hypothetical protein
VTACPTLQQPALRSLRGRFSENRNHDRLEAFTAALSAAGHHYDGYAEEFRHGQRTVDDPEELQALVPGMTLDELADGRMTSMRR